MRLKKYLVFVIDGVMGTVAYGVLIHKLYEWQVIAFSKMTAFSIILFFYIYFGYRNSSILLGHRVFWDFVFRLSEERAGVVCFVEKKQSFVGKIDSIYYIIAVDFGEEKFKYLISEECVFEKGERYDFKYGKLSKVIWEYNKSEAKKEVGKTKEKHMCPNCEVSFLLNGILGGIASVMVGHALFAETAINNRVIYIVMLTLFCSYFLYYFRGTFFLGFKVVLDLLLKKVEVEERTVENVTGVRCFYCVLGCDCTYYKIYIDTGDKYVKKLISNKAIEVDEDRKYVFKYRKFSKVILSVDRS